MGLGRKFSSKDEDFMTCYSQFSTSNKGGRPKNNKSGKGIREDNPAGN
jgi:hypothetical protein